MDTRDVSDDARYVEILNQLKEAAEQAMKRKGEKPAHLVPLPMQILKHTAKIHASQRKKANLQSQTQQVLTTHMPAPYPPCTIPVDSLRPIVITDMRLENHHRGQRIALRVVTPADRMAAVMAIVSDEHGNGAMISLYHQPEESIVPCEQTVHDGRVCIVKEPFFKATVSGDFAIRVDHVNDIVWLDESDMRVPEQWRVPARLLKDRSNAARSLGNLAVKAEDWSWAKHMYSTAIRVAMNPEDERLALLNRALANLKLGHVQESLHDVKRADSGRDPSQPPSEKLMFREARALYELAEFKDAATLFEKLLAAFPANKSAEAELNRAQARLHEQTTGEYDFHNMNEQAKAPEPIIDCATFKGPVEVRKTRKKGRGLFVTRDVEAGELLICEKAYAYVYAGEDHDLGRRNIQTMICITSNTVTVGGKASLITQIVQKLAHSHPGSSNFKELHRGSYQKSSDTSGDGVLAVDTFLVSDIVRLNCFGAPRTSRDQFYCEGKKDTMKERQFGTTGLWILASRINHSCVSNCFRAFIGDMQIIRAAQDLKAGTELRFGYQSRAPYARYADVQKGLASWGFVCDCAMCLESKETSALIWRRRDEIHDGLKAAFYKATPAVTRVKQLLTQLDETYPSGNQSSGFRLETFDPYAALGSCLFNQGKALQAIEAWVKALEARGYSVVALPLRTKASDKPKFEIRTWGQPDVFSVAIFARLMAAYYILAPSVVPSIRQYAKTAYRINVGEDETFEETFENIH